jgi:hypothetical protein
MGSSSTPARVTANAKKPKKKASADASAALLPRHMSRRRGRRSGPPPPPPPPPPPAEPYPLSGSTSRRAAASPASNAAAKLAKGKAAAANAAALKAQRETAAALKAQREAAAALKAQREAACPFAESASWRLEVENVVGKVGTVKQTAHATQYLGPGLPTAVHHVVNPVLQTAYERKKEELAARPGGAANVNERFLFHGTSMANAEAIISSNFCLSKVRNTRCRCYDCVPLSLC